MKKIISVMVIAFFFTLSVNAQVFNTGETIKPGEVSVGVSPTYYNTASGTMALFLYAGYGISSSWDFGFRYGLFDGVNYIGADIESCIYNQNNLSVSLTGGIHGWKDVGIGVDGIFNLTLQVEQLEFYSGLDADINFMKAPDERNSITKLWIPIGFNANIMDNLELLLEANVPVSDNNNAIYCGGLVLYFNR